MEDARKMLNDLMGLNRDVDLKTAKKMKGERWKDDSMCKFFLLGFCPQHEELFKNSKKTHLQIGECHKLHSEPMKEEFERSPDRKKYEREYVRELLRYLEGITKRVDELLRATVVKNEMYAREAEMYGPSQTAKKQLELVKADCAKLLLVAEELAEKGDIEGSREKAAEHEVARQKLLEYEEKAKEPMREDLCPICGTRVEEGENAKSFSHTEGRIHQGFVKIRKWIPELRDRLNALEDERAALRAELRDKEDGGEDNKDKGDDDKPRESEKSTRNRDDSRSRRRGEKDRGGDRRGDRDDRGRRDDRGYDRDRRGDRGYDRRGGGGRDRYDDGYRRGRSRSGGR